MAEVAAIFNEIAERNQHLTGELARVRRLVGREGRLSERLEVGAGEGAWGAAVDNCNALIDDLARPMAEVGRVLGSIAEGDLEQRMELRALGPDGGTHPLRGEFLKVGRTVNGLVDSLSEFTDEVTRVARRGRHRGQAGRPGPGARGLRQLEGPHRLGQHDGGQADRAGPRHRPGDHGGGQGRPVAEDHRGCRKARCWS